MITVLRAPPFATVQDAGRFGRLAEGVPRSGYADASSAIAANRFAGSSDDAALIEIAVAGGSFRFLRDATFALTGARIEATLAGRNIDSNTTVQARAGDELAITRIIRGRFVYLALRGGIEVPQVLGSRSTYLPARLGGFHGRTLRAGDVLLLGDSTMISAREAALRSGTVGRIEIVRGPQWDLFDRDTRERFIATEFRIAASDRAGYRLDGATFEHAGDAAMLSEPTCIGAIQVPHGGSPIVLMHDGPTIGGYPKIAVVRQSSLGTFAQLVPGENVRFSL